MKYEVFGDTIILRWSVEVERNQLILKWNILHFRNSGGRAWEWDSGGFIGFIGIGPIIGHLLHIYTDGELIDADAGFWDIIVGLVTYSDGVFISQVTN